MGLVHAAQASEKRNKYKIVIGKAVEKAQLRRSNRGREDNIKIYIKIRSMRAKRGSSGSGKDSLAFNF
jgi:hypothetical protein